MDPLNIYTLGGGKMLTEVLLGISSVTSDFSYQAIVAAFALFGFSLAIINGLASGKGDIHTLAYKPFLILFTAILFLTPVDVKVVDVMNDEEHQILVSSSGVGVPAGVGIVSSFSSSAGYRLTELFEQFLSSVDGNNINGMLEGGYSNASKVMSVLGYFSDPQKNKKFVDTLAIPVAPGATQALSFDYPGTLGEFYQKCYYPWIKSDPEGGIHENKILSAEMQFEKMEELMEVSHNVIKWNLPDPMVTTGAEYKANDGLVFCNAGGDINGNAMKMLVKLHEVQYNGFTNDIMRKSMDAEVLNYVKKKGIITPTQINDNKVPGCESMSGAELNSCVTFKAAAKLFAYDDNNAGVNNPHVMLATYLSIGEKNAAHARYAQSTNSSQMEAQLESATLQRNIQSAADLAMWEIMVPKILSFFQIFLYAVSPFVLMIFLTGISGYGQYLFKYFSSFFWIALFMPIAQVGSYFITKNSQDAFAILSKEENFLTAISTNPDVLLSIQDANHIASMMLVATPILSLMIVTGSFYAMTSLASRMSGGDHFNEKGMAPDAIDSKAMASHDGVVSRDAVSGIDTKSTMSAVGFNGSNVSSVAKSHNSQAVDQAGHTVGSSITKGMENSNMSGADRSYVADQSNQYSLGEASSQGRTEAINSAITNNTKFNEGKTYSHNEDTQSMFRESMSGKITGGTGAIDSLGKMLSIDQMSKFLNVSADAGVDQAWSEIVKDSVADQSGISKDQATQFNDSLNESRDLKYTNDDKMSASEKVADMTKVASAFSEKAGSSQGEEVSQSITKSISDAETASNNITTGANISLSEDQAVKSLALNPELNANANELFAGLHSENNNFRQFHAQESKKLENAGVTGHNNEVRSNVRALALLSQNENFTTDQQEKDIFDKFLAPVGGLHQNSANSAINNSDVGDKVNSVVGNDNNINATKNSMQETHESNQQNLYDKSHGLAQETIDARESIGRADQSLNDRTDKAINTQFSNGSLELQMDNVKIGEKGQVESFTFGTTAGVYGTFDANEKDDNGNPVGFKAYVGEGDNQREVSLNPNTQKQLDSHMGQAVINGSGAEDFRENGIGKENLKNEYTSNTNTINKKSDEEAGLGGKPGK